MKYVKLLLLIHIKYYSSRGFLLLIKALQHLISVRKMVHYYKILNNYQLNYDTDFIVLLT